ncbi:hypothetical protein NQ315_005958 [Exocentrus adspersus]|uniref:Beta-1,3-glucan-binding protein n=1 Tax=Exocentrus adspersus TaxID=1586481 RepID=A0AAV8VAZ3_9CUCU|nr:hypothetical protein NQ315_005958 [Exocentrus adspersus]
MLSKKELLLLCLVSDFCYGEFVIPQVTLEAYTPAGFRASIPADKNTELFAFHGKLNKEISQIEYGDFNGDVKVAKNGYFTYYNPNLKLSEDDVVHYWFFVQNNQLGYRKDGQKWRVTELLPEPGSGCQVSVTKVSDKTNVCKDKVVFEDSFTEALNEEKWTLEQYMPGYPDFEFVLYKKDPDVTFFKDGKLHIKPKLREDKEALMTMENISVELGDGCTRPANCGNRTYLIKNPVVSGRLETKITFTYGEFEVKAKVPSGDWLYPEIYLEDSQGKRILIAYTRGNKQLTGNAGDDLGNSLLFGGPVSNHKEPARSSKLSSYLHNAPLSQSSHTYKLRWTPGDIQLFFDGKRYGNINTEPDFTGSNPSTFKLVLGVGAGGLHDFPDGYKSNGDYVKPWINYKATQVSDFYHSRSSWYPSWSTEGRQLEVEYVKVTAI